MSDQQGVFKESGSAPVDILKKWYHIPTLAGIFILMLWTRLQSYGNFVRNGQVYFRGNDPWYHLRETSYLMANYPNRLPFDVFTGFPLGRQAGQFGTLWDHIMVVSTWIAGPIMGGTEEVMLIMAPLAGSLVAIPTYFIAKRFVDRPAALAGAVTLALLPGTFFSYSLVGFPDHTAAEVLFQSIAVLGFLVAFGVAEREKPVWELVVDRDWTALKRPVGYAAAAGVGLGLYIWTWQPGILMVGFTGIYLAVKITSDVYHDQSPEPVAFAGAVAMGVTTVMQLIALDTLSFDTTGYSLLQVILPLGVAAGAVFLAWLARFWESRSIDMTTYPPAVGGLIVASVGVIWAVLPSLYSLLIGNLLGFVGFSASAGARTIGEGQPPLQNAAFSDFVISQYGLAFFLALGAVVYILARPLYDSDDFTDSVYIVSALALVGSVYAVPQLYGAIGGLVGVSWQVVGLALAAALLVGATFLVEYDAEELYLVVWAAFIGSAAFTQVRFNYYLAVVVAVGAAYFLQVAFDVIDLSSLAALRDIEGWQAMTALAVIAILFVPLVGAATPVWAAGASTGPGNVVQWDQSLQWMNDETPVPGELEGHDNAMDPYATYERPADDDFEYPEGAYGVQSWWDYGHWITTRAERIPNANPFQQNAGEAADYLLAPSEQQAHQVWADQSTEGANTRYVMVDSQMASPNSKFNAPVTFYSGNETTSDFNRVIYQQRENGGFGRVMQVHTQRYHESQMIRLYEHYGSAVDPQPVVVDWQPQAAQTQGGDSIQVDTLPQNVTRTIQRFENVSAAREYVADDGSAQVGGLGGVPSERVAALEHYRLVHVTDTQGSAPSVGQARVVQQLVQNPRAVLGESLQSAAADDFVKTFERVPGATLEGSGAEPGAEVRAAVQLEKPTGETFIYQQYAEADANGEFTFTLPYSTTGYDAFGPENGYTNTSVTATGPYEITTGVTDPTSEASPASARANVTEAQVVGVDETATTVELERIVVRDSGDEGDTSSDADTTSGETSGESPTEGTSDDTTASDSPDDTTTEDTTTDDTATDDTATSDSADDTTNGSDSDGGYQLTPVTGLAAGASIATPRLRRVG
ncbi:oligosaccharyl transferase, archaeosortase A system-associated [Halorubrum sp. SY-15]|uniref:oligosaccharyl transferase, archaeosortase A system-associated n=1 Tax=Halorubrum sp. SY-15 TaxID=3402277 RepID=UPI003EBAA58B